MRNQPNVIKIILGTAAAVVIVLAGVIWYRSTTPSHTAPSPSDTPIACTLIGADQGYFLTIEPIPDAQPYTVTLQRLDAGAVVEEAATRVEPADPSSLPWLSITTNDQIPESSAVQVEITQDDGSTQTLTAPNVEPVFAQPNGPGCPPKVWQLSLVLEGKELKSGTP